MTQLMSKARAKGFLICFISNFAFVDHVGYFNLYSRFACLAKSITKR
jgi:hypothetical protein